MPEGTAYDLALYRLEKASGCIGDARLLLENGSFASAANRAYYAIFYSARALMALNDEDRKKHSGIIAYFQRTYIKSGLIGSEYSDIIKSAFEIRQEADYEDFYILSKDDAVKQVENAEKFYKRIGDYIDESH